MLKKIRLAPDVQNVVAGGLATVHLPLGPKYHSLMINYKTNANQSTIESDIELVRIKVGGKTQRELSAKHILRCINIPNGIAFVAGYLPIFFSEPWLRHKVDEEVLGWGTADVQSFSLEIKIASGATAPTLSVTALIEEVSQPMGAIVKWNRVSEYIGGTSTVRRNNLIAKTRGALKRLHIVSATDTASANISAVREIADGNIVHESTKALNDAILATRGITAQNMGGANSNTIYTVAHDFDENVDSVLALQPVANHELELTAGAAATYDIITEIVGPRD